MNRSLLLRIAAGLALVTCVSHTIGTFMPIPAEQTQMLSTIDVMKATLIPMPIGSPRNYMEILDGNNICTSVLLALCAMLLFSMAGSPKGRETDRVILITSLALAIVAMVSIRYFFPVPAAFTGLAALLALVARSRDFDGGRRPHA
jgi:hypothetical protein